jgi:lipid-binding SYLF domain-containing protein
MKSTNSPFRKLMFILFVLGLSLGTYAQVGAWNPELENESRQAMNDMIKDAPKLQSFYDAAYGMAVFPKITKAGLGIGGAGGKGIVYKNKEIIGSAKLRQASFGLQAGGQQYSEVIFFENKESLDRFTNGNLKFDAQASAVAITEGASVDVAYQNGVAVFTRVQGGLMFEASIGGQHFKYEPVKK